MGEQCNLTEENVQELTSVLEEMQKNNPDLEYHFFKQNIPFQQVTKYIQEKALEGFEERLNQIKSFDRYKIINPQPTNREIMDKLEELEKKIQFIFDDHVLINGKFKKILNILQV